jgi:predicted RNA binding protein YcfA (HicA-like mRNA interferase family)
VKRRDLERMLRNLGWRLLRHGRRHDLWARNEEELAVPRHAEINERTAREILLQAGGEH